MKNYSINEYQEKTFILNYNIENDEIIVNLASGSNYKLPYIKENEIMILERMKEQVLNANEFLKHAESKEKKSTYSMIILSIIAIFLYRDYSFNIFTLAFYVPALKKLYDLLYEGKYVDDVKKNQLFLEHEELFKKENIKKEHLKYLSKKARNLMSLKDITLNDLDNFYYSDIKTYLNGLEDDKKALMKKKESS